VGLIRSLLTMLGDPLADLRRRAVRDVRLRIREGVLRASQDLVRAHPTVEVGGKYVGYVSVGNGRFDLEVVDYIDSGPRARRSATHHLPDPDYQVRVFRSMEAVDPAVHHLGSWHSHHPHGYRRLSAGDVEGYRESVDSRDHLPQVFLASLVVDAAGLRNATHHLFVKGNAGHVRLPRGCVSVVPGGRRFHDDPLALGLTLQERPDDAPWFASVQARHLIARLDRALTAHFPHLTTLTRGTGEIVWRGPAGTPGPVVGFEVALRSPTLLTVRIERCHEGLAYTVDPQNGEVSPEALPSVVERLLSWPAPDPGER